MHNLPMLWKTLITVPLLVLAVMCVRARWKMQTERFERLRKAMREDFK